MYVCVQQCCVTRTPRYLTLPRRSLLLSVYTHLLLYYGIELSLLSLCVVPYQNRLHTHTKGFSLFSLFALLPFYFDATRVVQGGMPPFTAHPPQLYYFFRFFFSSVCLKEGWGSIIQIRFFLFTIIISICIRSPAESGRAFASRFSRFLSVSSFLFRRFRSFPLSKKKMFSYDGKLYFSFFFALIFLLSFSFISFLFSSILF